LTIQLDTNLFLLTFELESFEEIDEKLQSMAPSMMEYYLSDLANSNLEDKCYLENSKIQFTHYLGEYHLHIDYSENIYLEFNEKQDNYETGSLW